MKLRLSKHILIFGALGLLGIGVIWLFVVLGNNNDVVVPPDFRVERQVASKRGGDSMTRDILIKNGTLTYEDGKQSRKLSDSELKTLVSKVPWPVNDRYTSDGGGDVMLTSLTITHNREVTRIEFDNAWGTKVAEEVSAFDAYLDDLAGYPRYPSPR